MTKKRWNAAWTATLAIAIPIDAGDPQAAMAAKDALDKLTFMLRADHPGSTVEIVRAGFGKVEAAKPAEVIVPVTAEELEEVAKEFPDAEVVEPWPEPITELPAHLDRRQKAAGG